MSKMLCYNLTLDEKVYLANLVAHPGFRVLQRMMEEACKNAEAEVIRLNPEEDGYEKKLKARQLTARAMADFCTSLIKSFNVHTTAAVEEDKQKRLDEALREAGAPV